VVSSYRAYSMSPDPKALTGEEILDSFLQYVRLTGLELYPEIQRLADRDLGVA
jgi:hypothetical protein